MTVLIKGGRIVTAADDYVADVFVDGERISLIGESLDLAADHVIDAAGKYVLPGCIDPHTHLDMLWRGQTTVDDFYHGHVAAAFGGTTTHVDFCIQGKGQTYAEALEIWHAKREGKAVIDSGFHMIVTDIESGTLKELASLPEEHGVTSYKLFMAYNDSLRASDETLFKVMQVAAHTGALVMVHAENGDAIEVLMADAVAAGRLTRARPRADAAARDRRRGDQPGDPARPRRRRAAIRRPRLVQGVARANRARAAEGLGRLGRDLYSVLLRRHLLPGARVPRGIEVRVHTPATPEGQPGDPLERRPLECAPGHLHRPLRLVDRAEQKAGGTTSRLIPNGAGGMENRLQMIHQFGVREGRISLHRMVELLATNPAKLFGLYPRKGTIAVGSDADLVVFDPEKTLTISGATHHSASEMNIFEGAEVTGSPEIVLRRGEIIVEGDELLAKPGSGQFVRRARFGEELHPSPASSPA